MLLLPEQLTAAQAGDALRLLKLSLQRETGDRLVVDASTLSRFDSSALAVLLECRRLAQAWGRRFELRAAPPALLRLARLYGVEELVAARP